MHISSTFVAATLPLMALASPSLMARQNTKITVDPSKKYQTMDGFGFSAAFQRANLIVNLPEPKRTELLDILFSNTTGAGFTILRNGLGSTPNSNSDYMNTILPTNPGSPTSPPRYSWDGKDSGQFWLSQQAVKYGVNRFYSNAWSAPGFMKTNNNDMNGGYLRDEWRQAYADYLIQYIKYYLDAGIPITHLGFLNEPDLSTSYASMLSNGQQAAAFIKILRPSLDEAGMKQVGIVCCESTGWGQANNIYSGIRSSGADGQLSVVSSHEYTGRAGGSLSSTHPGWQTEYADLNGQWTTTWAGNGGAGDGMTWAQNIYQAITNANVSAYLAWEGVQAPNPNTNEKLIKCDASDFQVSKRLWAFAQYSRTVRPGAVRLGTSGGNFKTTAFKNVDGSVAVNIINTGGSAATVSVSVTGFVPGSAVSWLTDNTHDFSNTTLTVGSDGSVSGSVPARAMVSFVLAAAAAPAA